MEAADNALVFDLNPSVTPPLNESLLWDLEAPILRPFFRKYEEINHARVATVSSHVNQFHNLLQGIGLLSNQKAFSILLQRLHLLQERKIQYQQITQELQVAALHFKNCVEHVNSEWNTQRLDRAVVSYLLKMRYVYSANDFAVRRNVQALFDFEPFYEAVAIVQALRNKDLGPAKAWCNRNAQWSPLDLQLLCQEYIEYVRGGEKQMAVSFAWKFTVEFWNYKEELLQVLAAVAFGCNSTVLRYKKLFDEERWDYLVGLFEKQFNWRQGFKTDSSALCILLESGITALKVPFCFDDGDCKEDDPLQHEYFQTFASSLPRARPYSTQLFCHMTKKPFTTEHPAFMLPNGYAYSQEAILKMQNGDEIKCWRTGSVFKMGDVKELKVLC